MANSAVADKLLCRLRYCHSTTMKKHTSPSPPGELRHAMCSSGPLAQVLLIGLILISQRMLGSCELVMCWLWPRPEAGPSQAKKIQAKPGSVLGLRQLLAWPVIF